MFFAMPRIREIGFSDWVVPAGPMNGITDVPGVGIGHYTLIEGEGAELLRRYGRVE